MNKKQEGLTVLDLFKLVFYKWKRLVIITLVLSVFVVLAIHFGYTSLNKVYSIEFTYNDDNLENNHYADGTKFNYLDIISEKNIIKVVEANGEFSKLNYKEMLAKNEIELTRVITNADQVEANSKVTPEYSYNISIKASCFGLIGTKGKAQSFLTKLIAAPIEAEESIASSMNFNSNLGASNYTISYSNKIAYLAAQYEYNNLYIKELIDMFGDFEVTDKNGNKSHISGLADNAKAFFTNYPLEVLSDLAISNGYVDITLGNKSFYQNKKTSLVSLINDNETLITSLEDKRDEYIAGGSATTAEAFNARIVELVEENQLLVKELTTIERCLYNYSLLDGQAYEMSTYVKEADVKKFATKASYEESYDIFKEQYDGAYETLEGYSAYLASFSTYAYANYSNVNYHYPSIMVASGGFGIVIEVIISIVVAFVIAGFVNIIIDYKHLEEITNPKKEEKE